MRDFTFELYQPHSKVVVRAFVSQTELNISAKIPGNSDFLHTHDVHADRP